MKTALRLSFGLLLTISAVGCHTCQSNCQSSCDNGCGNGCGGQRSCLHKVFSKLGGGGGNCGCQSDCGCDDEPDCDCGRHHHVKTKRSKNKFDRPTEAAMYGYDNSVVYTGNDYQGMPQQGMGMMPMAGGCSGCAGGAPMMSMPSTTCAGCAGSGISPNPNQGGCASCGGNHPTPSAPPTSGGCASCGAGATADSFYNPLGPNHQSPAPAPPAEGVPNPSIESIPGGDKAVNSGDQIQKIHWVPRQL